MALDLQLEYIGGGGFRTRSRLDFELAEKTFGAGERVRAKVTHQRSVTQNAFFHAVIQSAFDNQRAGPFLPSWKHLKSWLLIKVGHCDVKQFSPEAMKPEVAAYLRGIFDTVDFTTDGKSIWMKTAKSVSFKELGSDGMKRIVDEVIEVICTDICPGIDPDELRINADEKVRPIKREREAA